MELQREIQDVCNLSEVSLQSEHKKTTNLNKIKDCIRCGQKFIIMGRRQKRCSSCRKIAKKESTKRWFQRNQNYRKNYYRGYKNYYQKYHQKMKNDKYYIKRRKKNNENWIKRNPERYKELLKRSSKKHYEKGKNNPIEKQRTYIRKKACRELKDKLVEERGKCETCGSDKNLEIHHIVYNNDFKNLKLLCKGCHIRLHHKKQI